MSVLDFLSYLAGHVALGAVIAAPALGALLWYARRNNGSK
jgi:hypothetical protein